jgi:hypothetical protein
MERMTNNSAVSARDRWVRSIERNTERLRVHADPALQRIRQLLAERGVDIHGSLVANLMPEDTDLLSGLIVSREGRVYEFEFDWRRTKPEHGHFAVWRDLTDTYESRAFREPISVALAMGDETRPAVSA